MSKDEKKPSGLRAFFIRRKRTSPDSKEQPKSANNAPSESLPQDAAGPSAAQKRKYVPRYAARDMVLSMPVEQRPDLVARAREAKRQGVYSEIGFAPSIAASNMSIRSVSSRGRSVSPLATHPNLRMHRNATADRLLHSRASGSSLRSGPPGLPRSVSTPTPLRSMMSMPDIEAAESSSHPPRLPPPRAETSTSGASPSEQQLYRDLDNLVFGGGDAEGSVGSNYTRPTTPGDLRNGVASPPRPSRQYFSHQSIPNLRANNTNHGGGGGGKGKERADSTLNVSRNFEPSSSQTSYESRDAYVIQTTRANKAANGLTPPVPSSVTPSSNSSISGSTDSRYLGEFSFNATRPGSLSTAITEYTEQGEEQTLRKQEREGKEEEDGRGYLAAEGSVERLESSDDSGGHR